MMKKLMSLLALTFTLSTASAGMIESSQIWLLPNQETIAPQGSLSIPMNLLYPQKPYKVLCYLLKSNVSSNPVIAAIFVSTPVDPVTYRLNGIPFTQSVALTAPINNYLTVDGVEYLSGLYPWSSSELIIENKDQTDAITVIGCVANPILGSDDK